MPRTPDTPRTPETPHALDFAVIGGGIVGLSVAAALQRRFPGARLAVVEKEATWAAHQTGRNSGVVHSGLYYKPGSLKARLCREGRERLIGFCGEHGIPVEVCGKLVVATDQSEIGRLEELRRRGEANGLKVERLGDRAALREREPEVAGVAGLWVPETGVVDFGVVARTLAAVVEAAGAHMFLGFEVERLQELGGGWLVKGRDTEFQADFVVNCAGLQSDRVARLSRVEATGGAKIVPFRGEYYELVPERRHLVRGLIYPVPDPKFPFLGVHLTRGIDGNVHAGPNAVLALAREGYRKQDVDLRDLWDTLSFPGFWRMAGKYWRAGAAEMWRSWSKAAFVRDVQRLMPAIGPSDLVANGAGVRAQALLSDGSLADDFQVVQERRALHVLNAPSPAATGGLAIGDYVAGLVPSPAAL